jgi:hypothetical protein
MWSPFDRLRMSGRNEARTNKCRGGLLSPPAQAVCNASLSVEVFSVGGSEDPPLRCASSYLCVFYSFFSARSEKARSPGATTLATGTIISMPSHSGQLRALDMAIQM